MGRLRTEEVRRLLRYLSERVEDPERLAEIEDALRDKDAEEFLREPDLLTYFPEQNVEIAAAGAKWQLRIIPHALLANGSARHLPDRSGGVVQPVR